LQGEGVDRLRFTSPARPRLPSITQHLGHDRSLTPHPLSLSLQGEGNAVGRYRALSDSIIRLPYASTVARWPGNNTVVAAGSSMIAGPLTAAPGRSRSRSYTADASRPWASKSTSRRPFSALRPAPFPPPRAPDFAVRSRGTRGLSTVPNVVRWKFTNSTAEGRRNV